LTISYVFPNVSSIPQRGNLSNRWEYAKKTGCSFIEVPADFIKTPKEAERTGLNLCDIPSKEKIPLLYSQNVSGSDCIPYILHTEPSLSRRDGFGMSVQAPLRWNDESWRIRMTQLICDISEFFGCPAKKIEIHPGDRRNSPDDILKSVHIILAQYEKLFRIAPEILLENRTGQVISTGKEIAEICQRSEADYPDLLQHFGIVLDIQQLFTVTKGKFLLELDTIPKEFIKGFHIHAKHQAPSITDPIPWEEVFSWIRGIRQDLIINPEVLLMKNVGATIGFCKEKVTH
jgi:hypothetical protein